jgi:hypothetical protein
MAADIFLSYSRADSARALVIKDRLVDLGLTVFFDTEGLDGGEIWPDELDKELKTAGVVVGVWSQHALTRPWVKIECDIGKTRGVLVPVQIEPIAALDRPAAFWNIQFIDLSDFAGDIEHAGWLKFVQSLARTLDRPDLLERESARQSKTGSSMGSDVQAELQAIRDQIAALATVKEREARSASTPNSSIQSELEQLSKTWQALSTSEDVDQLELFKNQVGGTHLEVKVARRIQLLRAAEQMRHWNKVAGSKDIDLLEWFKTQVEGSPIEKKVEERIEFLKDQASNHRPISEYIRCIFAAIIGLFAGALALQFALVFVEDVGFIGAPQDGDPLPSYSVFFGIWGGVHFLVFLISFVVAKKLSGGRKLAVRILSAAPIIYSVILVYIGINSLSYSDESYSAYYIPVILAAVTLLLSWMAFKLVTRSSPA